MCRSKIFANSLLLLTVPALVAYPQADLPDIYLPSQSAPSDAGSRIEFNNQLFSYDDILDLIEEIEDGDIERRCTPEEIDGINRFVALLAKEGLLPGDIYQEFALNQDIVSLLSQPDSRLNFSYSLDGGYSVEPAVFYSDGSAILCKSWVKKQWDQTRKFVKNHKKEILIGAAIVVAVALTVTIVVVVASTSAATAAGSAIGAGAAAASGESSKSHPTGNEKTQIQQNPQTIEAIAIPVNEVPALKGVIDEQVNEFKGQMAAESLMNPEMLPDPISPAFVQNAREFGAILAHKVFDGASEIVSVVPQLLEEVRDVGERFIPKNICDLQPSEICNPLGNYEYAVEKGHKAIDQFFGVDQSHIYNGSVKKPEFACGVLPPPSMIGSLVSTEGRVAATQASSTCGWRPGQPIQNRTFWGGVPKWSTVRGRYWKNMAIKARSNPELYGYRLEDIPLMERGLAPKKFNSITGQWESKELHHNPPQRDGGLFDFVEVWPDEHAGLDINRYLGR